MVEENFLGCTAVDLGMLRLIFPLSTTFALTGVDDFGSLSCSLALKVFSVNTANVKSLSFHVAVCDKKSKMGRYSLDYLILTHYFLLFDNNGVQQKEN